MAPHCAALQALLLLLLVLALANFHLSSCQSVKGSVSCLNCEPYQDLSGVGLRVKCRNERKLAYALTNNKGYFNVKNIPTNSSSPNCFVMLLGGPVQLWAFKKSMVSKILRSENSYGLSTPLTFFTSYPSEAVQGRTNNEFGVSAAPSDFPPVGSTDTIPLIFFFPFLPIIGIP